MDDLITHVNIRQLGRQAYLPVWQAMQAFTDERDKDTQDEIWLVEHDPVFTQGQAGKAEHLLALGDIPIIQVDRGGQVTYHGPGQQVAYCLIDLKRKKIGVRQLVCAIEKAVVNLLDSYAIQANIQENAPGVYVNQEKICSLGLRVRRGSSFHGLALNVAMDKEPFDRINPCGYEGLKVTQIKDLGGPVDLNIVSQDLVEQLMLQLGYQSKAILGPNF
jgi:lipoyl(octanoyl) transferase